MDQNEYIDLLSEEVHNAWMQEKLSQGFHPPSKCTNLRDGATYHKFKRSCEKCHIDLYPYHELPENIKEYDRVTVRAVIAAQEKLKKGRYYKLIEGCTHPKGPMICPKDQESCEKCKRLPKE